MAEPSLLKGHLLIPASVRGRAQPKRREAGGDIAGGQIVAAFAGIAPFQKVVGQEGDMGAEGIRSEGRLRPLLGNGRGRKEKSRRSEEHTSELQSLMRISYAVFCLKKKKKEK